jgi:hypothetical protein
MTFPIYDGEDAVSISMRLGVRLVISVDGHTYLCLHNCLCWHTNVCGIPAYGHTSYVAYEVCLTAFDHHGKI